MTTTASCLTNDMVHDYLDGSLTPLDHATATGHLANCASCRDELAHVQRLFNRLDTALFEPLPHSVTDAREALARLKRDPAYLKMLSDQRDARSGARLAGGAEARSSAERLSGDLRSLVEAVFPGENGHLYLSPAKSRGPSTVPAPRRSLTFYAISGGMFVLVLVSLHSLYRHWRALAVDVHLPADIDTPSPQEISLDQQHPIPVFGR